MSPRQMTTDELLKEFRAAHRRAEELAHELLNRGVVERGRAVRKIGELQSKAVRADRIALSRLRQRIEDSLKLEKRIDFPAR